MAIDWENYKIKEFEDISIPMAFEECKVFISRQVDTIDGEEFWLTVIDKKENQFDGKCIKREELEELKLAIEMMLEIESV